jgi:hypothetical protein
MLFSKSIRLGLAVCHLVSGGFYGEAFGLMRSVLEAYFIAKYVSTSDSEERADSYLNFAMAHFYNREEIRKKYFPEVEPLEWLTQEMLDETKGRYANTRHWVSAYNMATEYYDHPLEVDPKTGKGFQATGKLIADYSFFEIVSFLSASIVTSTRAPSLTATSLPLLSFRVLGTRISR